MINFIKQRGVRISIKLGSFFKRRKTDVVKDNTGAIHWVERLLRHHK